MASTVRPLRLLHDLARDLAAIEPPEDQVRRAFAALKGGFPGVARALLVWPLLPNSRPTFLADHYAVEAADVVARGHLHDHCAVDRGVVDPASLLTGPGLPHWEDSEVVAVGDGATPLGAAAVRADLSDVDREFLCALGAVLGASLSNTQSRHRAVEQERQRKRFERYLSPQVAEHLATGDYAAICAGERRHAAILFSDIRGFTRLSNAEDPVRIVDLLNRYFETMTEIVFRRGGMVDKLIGDGLMAAFGVPNELPAPAEAAVRCAQEMLEGLSLLQPQLQVAGLPAIDIGVGIHFGEVLFGEVGSGRFADLTVIGPAVNLASRVESATRTHGVRVLCSEAVFEACEHPDEFVALSPTSLKGVAEPVKLFRPVWG